MPARSVTHINPETDIKTSSKWLYPVLYCLVLFLLAIYPRLAQIGNYIGMDEGSYSFICSLFAQNYPNKGVYGLSFYPLLLVWTYLLPGNPMIWLRLCDMLAYLAMLIAFIRILNIESANRYKALMLSFIFLSPMSAPQVMDAGFKNSIPASLLFFWLAWLSIYTLKQKNYACLLAGACTACAVLLRESFILFAFLATGAVWLALGFRACLRYVCGALAFTILILLLYELAFYEDGGLRPFLEGYLGRGSFYAHEKWRILNNFIRKAPAYQQLFLLPLLVFLCSFLACCLKKIKMDKTFIFWFLTVPVALVEPLTKPGFAYHLAVCMPGLAVCTAICWRKCQPCKFIKPDKKPAFIPLAVVTLSFLAIIHAFVLLPGSQAIARTLQFLDYGNPASRAAYIAASQPMTVLNAIRKRETAPQSLSGSGFSFYLYPMSGWMPPKTGYFDRNDSYRLSDLSRSFGAMKGDSKRMAMALKMNPPQFIALGIGEETHETDYHEELEAIINSLGIYEFLEEIPASEKDYGFMGYRLYRRKDQPAGN